MPINTQKKFRFLLVFVVLATMIISTMCGCSKNTVEAWHLVKEYDIDGIDFESFKAIAEGLDKDKYYVSIEYESKLGDAWMAIFPKTGEYKLVANITKNPAGDGAKKYYDSLVGLGTLYTSDAIVRVNDMVMQGNGFIIKMLLENIGIKTHDSVTVPAESKLIRMDNLVPFKKAEKALLNMGYSIYSVDQFRYTIYSPDGTECFFIMRFLLPETDEMAYEDAKKLFSIVDKGINVYYCNTYVVGCVGDQWIKLTENISN